MFLYSVSERFSYKIGCFKLIILAILLFFIWFSLIYPELFDRKAFVKDCFFFIIELMQKSCLFFTFDSYSQ